MRAQSTETVTIPLVELLRVAAMASEVRAGVVEGKVILHSNPERPLEERRDTAVRVLNDADDMALALTETLRTALRRAGAA